jgi:hypothetical protein
LHALFVLRHEADVGSEPRGLRLRRLRLRVQRRNFGRLAGDLAARLAVEQREDREHAEQAEHDERAATGLARAGTSAAAFVGRD